MKKAFSAIMAAAVIVTTTLTAVPVQAAETTAVDAAAYTYSITPLLDSFNNCFFVETDNPDPNSFRFVDKSTIYSEQDYITHCDYNFADVRFDDTETLRVNGGYIFYSDYANSDGGEITLQSLQPAEHRWETPRWIDTNITLTLPQLYDTADWLIKTYADKDSFFENMDAVQKGFSSVCLYSGSSIRGKLKKTDDYWFLSAAGYIDQIFYIYSPYVRKDGKLLFASMIYPFRYDSLGFPSMMAIISQRLDSSSTYEWSENQHAYINVTYNGTTRIYGGAGIGEGQKISEDNIRQYFSFGQNGTKLALGDIKDLLDGYSKVEMDDDIPREDALTWKQVYDTVGDGAWVRISGSAWKNGDKWSFGDGVYNYLYQRGDGSFFSASEWGAGYSLYWGGDLGYGKDTWMDGRYIDQWRRYVPGEKFADHPNADIYLTEVTIPQIKVAWKWQYNADTGYYDRCPTVDEITEKTTNAKFYYNSENDTWSVDDAVFDDGCIWGYYIKELVEKGRLDKKYLDMVTLTREQAEAMSLDRNTDILPKKGYIFDGKVPCGTPFKNLLIGDADADNKVTISDATAIQRHAADITNPDGTPIINTSDEDSFEIADMNKDGVIDVSDATAIQFHIAE